MEFYKLKLLLPAHKCHRPGEKAQFFTPTNIYKHKLRFLLQFLTVSSDTDTVSLSLFGFPVFFSNFKVFRRFLNIVWFLFIYYAFGFHYFPRIKKKEQKLTCLTA